MRVLLDTHAFLWWLNGDERLSPTARELIGDIANVVHVSAASAWEIATKARLGKLPGAMDVAANIALAMPLAGVHRAFHHRRRRPAGGRPAGPAPGPFDRMLIAQAQANDMGLISNETLFDDYGIRRLW